MLCRLKRHRREPTTFLTLLTKAVGDSRLENKLAVIRNYLFCLKGLSILSWKRSEVILHSTVNRKYGVKLRSDPLPAGTFYLLGLNSSEFFLIILVQ